MQLNIVIQNSMTLDFIYIKEIRIFSMLDFLKMSHKYTKVSHA